MSNSLGKIFCITCFGESHGRCIGVVVDGCPAGLEIDVKTIQEELNKRKPGQSNISTTREEADEIELLSGVFKGYTTGAPICMLIWNKDVDSSKYEEFKHKPRPSHADYTAYMRYGGFNDYRGGGRFSGRITASYVMAGAIAKQILKIRGIKVVSFTKAIGNIEIHDTNLEDILQKTESNIVRCPDPIIAKKMIENIVKAKEEGDSLGGIVECLVLNSPIGIGQPIFDTLEGDLSKALFSIPAVKAIEFGEGIKATKKRGSENNDVFYLKNGKIVTKPNNSGGINGGISNGMPINCRIFVKPTPSISKPQRTVDMMSMKETEIKIQGRHDPCIVPRIFPVAESLISIVLVDHLIRGGIIPPVLENQS
jgi:chorismate synthase